MNNYDLSTKFKEEFKSIKGRNIDFKTLIMFNDPNLEMNYVYLIYDNHIYIMIGNTYELVNKIFYANIININNHSRVFTFRYIDMNYLFIYDKSSFVIFPHNDQNEIKYSLNFNDDIVKIYNVRSNNFLLYLSNSSIFYMVLNYAENFYNFTCNIQEIKSSSWGIFNIFNFKTTQYFDNVIILNPYITNVIFFLNEKSLKKIEYSKYDPFRPQLNFNINLSQYFSYKNKFTIDSADILYYKSENMYYIYFVIKEELTQQSRCRYNIFQILFDNDNNSIIDVNNNIKIHEEFSNFSSSYILVNKYKKEIHTIINDESSCKTYFYYTLDQNTFHKADDFTIKGINLYNSQERFKFDIMIIEKGILETYYNDKYIHLDKTSLFMKTISRIKNLPISISNSELGVEDHDIEMNEDNNIFSEYYKFFVYNNNHRALSDEIENFYTKIKNKSSDQIIKEFDQFLTNIIDDDSLNVDTITRNSNKADLVIIDYLRVKEKHIVKIDEFFKEFAIFNNLDHEGDLLILFLSMREKLVFAIGVRSLENMIIMGDDIVELGNRDIMSYIAKKFFENVYKEVKNNLHIFGISTHKPFYKQMLYSTVSKMDVYFEIILIAYNIQINHLDSKRDRSFISYLLILLLNRIFSEIIYNLHNNYSYFLNENSHKFINFMWLLKDECIKYYIKIFDEFINNLDGALIPNQILSDNLVNYVDYILYFNNLYCRLYNLNRDNFIIKKRILASLEHFNIDKTLSLAIKYEDYHTITCICYKHNFTNKLLDLMKEYDENKLIITYMLRLYLLLQSKNIVENKEIKFNFFKIFYKEYPKEVESVIVNFPKLIILYEDFLSTQNIIKNLNVINDEDYNDKYNFNLNEIPNDDIFLKILRILNSNNKVIAEENLDSFENNRFIKKNDKISDEINLRLILNHIEKKFDFSFNLNYSLEDKLQYLINNIDKLKYSIDAKLKYRIIYKLICLYGINEHMINLMIKNLMHEEFDIFKELFKSVVINNLDELSDDYRRILNKKSVLKDVLGYFNFDFIKNNPIPKEAHELFYTYLDSIKKFN